MLHASTCYLVVWCDTKGIVYAPAEVEDEKKRLARRTRSSHNIPYPPYICYTYDGAFTFRGSPGRCWLQVHPRSLLQFVYY